MPRPSSRLTPAITGRAREVGPVEAHERNVLAITRRIHAKERKLREALATAKRLRQELRADRRELRAVLQFKADVTEQQLEVAGQADGVDRSVALAEARPVSYNPQLRVAEPELTEAEALQEINEALPGGAK